MERHHSLWKVRWEEVPLHKEIIINHKGSDGARAGAYCPAPAPQSACPSAPRPWTAGELGTPCYVTGYRFLGRVRHQIQEQPIDGPASDLPGAELERPSPNHRAMPPTDSSSFLLPLSCLLASRVSWLATMRKRPRNW